MAVPGTGQLPDQQGEPDGPSQDWRQSLQSEQHFCLLLYPQSVQKNMSGSSLMKKFNKCRVRIYRISRKNGEIFTI